MPPIGPHHPVDLHIAITLRELRLSAGLSQTAIGRCVGVSYQQVQKYEIAMNRIAASRLWEFARALDVPVGFFFPDPETEGALVEPPEAEAIVAWARLYRQMPEEKRTALFKIAEAIRES